MKKAFAIFFVLFYYPPSSRIASCVRTTGAVTGSLHLMQPLYVALGQVLIWVVCLDWFEELLILITHVCGSRDQINIEHVHSRYSFPKRDSIHRGSSDRLSTECKADVLPPSHQGWIICFYFIYTTISRLNFLILLLGQSELTSNRLDY